LSGWEASTVQQDPVAKVNAVFCHGKLLWLVQVDTMVLLTEHGLSLYHFSIHLAQFSHPDDGGSTFL
jgi:hypothetical protein